MPEGPEIRRAAMRIDKVLRGREAEVVDFAQPHLQRYRSVLSGQQIDWVSSRGKALLTRFSNELTLYSHNQLYGRWYIVRRDQLPATNRTLRVAIHTATHSALLYSASDIEVLTPETLPLQKYLARLGPDALDDRVHWRDIVALLESPQFRRRTLAALYLDQGFVAGIGNYLRSEILFEARVNPFDRPCDLTRGQSGRLARATLDLTRQSLATAGITNKPSRVARARRAGLSRRHYRFAIFDRQGEACFGCQNPVQRLDVSGRRIYLCTTCQPPLRVNTQNEART
ncbi:MAG: endonuclease VIII [Gammaproteobacteria bacterium]|jgi:endonuclease-8|nr:endonuclease VIII [Gammaproteobacteria bacterium]